MSDAPQTLDELLECLESLEGEVLTTRKGESFPIGIWSMMASNVIRQQLITLHNQSNYIRTCYRPCQIGVRNEQAQKPAS